MICILEVNKPDEWNAHVRHTMLLVWLHHTGIPRHFVQFIEIDNRYTAEDLVNEDLNHISWVGNQLANTF